MNNRVTVYFVHYKFVNRPICGIFNSTHYRDFDKKFRSAPNWLKLYMPTVPQSAMMVQSCSVSIEGLYLVVPKWSNRSSKVVFSLDQWCTIVAYQIPGHQGGVII